MNQKQISKKLKFITDYLNTVPGYCFTIIKWQPEDVIENLSDLDVRIVVELYSNSVTKKLNETLAKLYIKNLGNSIVNSRTFEHPPNIHYFDELLKNFGGNPEIATWTLIHGNVKKFEAIKKYYDSQDYSDSNKNQYIKIIKSKRAYSLEPELVYDYIPTDQFRKYCLVWRYYATSLYAYASLYSKKRMIGKSRAISIMKSSFPKLKMANFGLLMDVIKDKNISVDSLWNILTNDLNLLSTKIETEDDTPNEDKFTDVKVINRSVILTRNKISRLTYYLSKDYLSLPFPKKLFVNLVIRETDDMHMIYNNLSRITKKYKGHLFVIDKQLYANMESHLQDYSNLLEKTANNAEQLGKYLSFCKNSISDLEKLNRLFLLKIENFT